MATHTMSIQGALLEYLNENKLLQGENLPDAEGFLSKWRETKRAVKGELSEEAISFLYKTTGCLINPGDAPGEVARGARAFRKRVDELGLSSEEAATDEAAEESESSEDPQAEVEDSDMSSPFEVKRLIVIKIDGEEYKGEVDDSAMAELEKLGKAFATKLDAYEKSRDELVEALGDAGVKKVQKPAFSATAVRGGRGGGPSKAKQDAAHSEHLNRIREWAKENDFEVSDRGRVAKNIIEAYNVANPEDAMEV
ncbi:histone-like nucleoid-structuring protein Lsr2 [Streptomyces sp. NPDC001407]|uniref:Lsr2 family DNA-binding protein n=1 Tax=Streptomyces sp. NPDC001407 TaxID=3364573 RepID=UPI0036C17D98